ncbi:MAG: methanethiol S-methyltransferase [Myxococcota bacterium]
MKRSAVLAFSGLSYVLFFGAFLYLIGFVTGFGVPKTVSGGPAVWHGPALIVNLGLVALFGVQHSVMARGWFKRAAARLVGPALNRSLFVLAASLVLVVTFLLWQPMPSVLWETSGAAAAVLGAGEVAGWLMVLVSTFLIDHFELFGLRQAYAHFRGREFQPPPMKTPGFYRYVRHPIYLGFLIAFWSAPTMTVGRLVFAAGMSSYILVGIRFEERDLLRAFGAKYRAYRERVGMLLPRPGRTARPEERGAERPVAATDGGADGG